MFRTFEAFTNKMRNNEINKTKAFSYRDYCCHKNLCLTSTLTDTIIVFLTNIDCCHYKNVVSDNISSC